MIIMEQPKIALIAAENREEAGKQSTVLNQMGFGDCETNGPSCDRDEMPDVRLVK